jgi:hypothetical protein
MWLRDASEHSEHAHLNGCDDFVQSSKPLWSDPLMPPGTGSTPSEGDQSAVHDNKTAASASTDGAAHGNLRMSPHMGPSNHDIP